MHIVVDPELKAEDAAAIGAALRAFNIDRTQYTGPHGEIGVLLKTDDGVTEGGLTANYAYGWMFVELLFVPEAARGQDLGTRLMAEAEKIARDKGLIGIWLDTFSFQAPGFYQKLGFVPFGQLDGYPGGQSRHFLKKLL